MKSRFGLPALYVLLATLAGGMSAWAGLPVVRLAASEAIATCSILAAFLFQVMLLLATVLTTSSLSAELLKELSEELDRKQRSAQRLFVVYVATIVAFIIMKMTDKWEPVQGLTWQFALSTGFAFGSVFLFALALLSTIAFSRLLLGLQETRHRLQMQEQRVQEQKARAARIQDNAPAYLDELPEEPHNRPFGHVH
jgi:SNF family Na+-dependent transporter